MLEVDEDSRLGGNDRARTRYGAADVPGEDAIADFYEIAVERLARLGIERYEISNFARPGFESRHNLKYWRREPYLGFGADAHSFDGGRRWQNPESAHEYVAGFPAPERVSADAAAKNGFSDCGSERASSSNCNEFADVLERFVHEGLVEREGTRVRLTNRGILVSNEVFAEFIEIASRPNRAVAAVLAIARAREMDHRVDGIGTRPLSHRQCVRTAGTYGGVSIAGNGRSRPDISPDRATGHMEQTRAAALFERTGHQARDVRRRICGIATSGAAMVPGTNRPVLFGGKTSVTIAPGQAVWSDAAELRFAGTPLASLGGRKLAVSFHVGGRKRSDDVACQGADDVLRDGPRRRSKRTRRGRSRIPLHHHLLVFSGCPGHDGARRYPRRRGVWRFHHRRHGLHAERRRPLAGRALAAPTRRLRKSRFGGQRRYRRESGRRARRIFAQESRLRAGHRHASAWSATCSAFRASPP